MADFEVAHLRIRGVDVVIVFLGTDFNHKSNCGQAEVQAALHLCSDQAGLAGNVVLVWQDLFGRFKFRAPYLMLIGNRGYLLSSSCFLRLPQERSQCKFLRANSARGRNAGPFAVASNLKRGSDSERERNNP